MAGQPAGSCDPRAARRRHHGRSDGREHGVDACSDLHLRSGFDGNFRLSVRAFAARGEPDAVRAEPRHRIPVHGGGGRCVARLGAILGAAILTVLQDYLQTLLPKLIDANGNFEIVIFGVVMVLLLQYARQGVWPFVARWFPKGPRAHVPDRAEPLTQCSKPDAGSPLLLVDKVRKEFSGLVAVNDVSFDVTAGEIIGLIGPNGAVKSTLLNAIMGALPSSGHAKGAVRYLGEDVSALAIEKRVSRGMCLVPESASFSPR